MGLGPTGYERAGGGTRRRLGFFALIFGTLMAFTGGNFGVLSASAQPEEHKVTICHRTNAVTNPYVTITVDESAVDGVSPPGGDHFGEHKGPLVESEAEAQALKDNGIMWGDIIPPVPPFHDGLNWPEGQAILENDCQFVGPPPTTAPPTTAPPVTAAPAPPPPPAPAARPPAPPAPGPAVAVVRQPVTAG